ncbi:ATP synthase F1 subunit delta [Schwartzia sp. (in: firmicutes)]
MLNLQLANKYSRAIFLLAQEENKLDEYGKELKQLSADIDSFPELKTYLASPMIPVQAKKEVAAKASAEEGLSQMVQNFFCMLVEKGRSELLDEIVSEYESFANEALGIVVADVTTARELKASQAESLSGKLAEVTGKQIKLRPHLDPKIIGGAIVRMGDKRIDGSLTGKLQALQAELLAD